MSNPTPPDDPTLPAPAAPLKPSIRSAGHWFIAGTAVIGATLGVFVGLSQTPVVAAALPLIVGMLGGVAGLMVARAKLDSELAIWRLKSVGASAFAFGLFAIAGGMLGMGIRTGAVDPFGQEVRASPRSMPEWGDLSLNELAAVLSLEALLQRKGVAHERQELLLDKAIQELESPRRRDRAALSMEVVAELMADLLTWHTETLAHAELGDDAREWLQGNQLELSELTAQLAGLDTDRWEPELFELLEARLLTMIRDHHGLLLDFSNNDMPESVWQLLQADRTVFGACQLLSSIELLEGSPGIDAIQNCIELLSSMEPLSLESLGFVEGGGRYLASG